MFTTSKKVPFYRKPKGKTFDNFLSFRFGGVRYQQNIGGKKKHLHSCLVNGKLYYD